MSLHGVTAPKLSRTDEMLRKLNVGPEFLDFSLPKGFFSHSQYVSWLICGKAYEFKYVKQTKTPNYPSTTRGSSTHSGVEYVLLEKMAGRAASLEVGRDLVGKKFDEMASGIEDWGDEDPVETRDTALKLFETYFVHGLPKINPLAVEKGFAKKIGDVPTVGWIDLIDEQPVAVTPGMTPEMLALAPKKRIIVDLKTSTTKWSDAEVAKDPQFTLYAMVEGVPDIRVDQLIPYKKGPAFVQANSIRTPEDAEVYTEHLNEVADFVRKGIFPKTTVDNWACNKKHCSFFHMCRGMKYTPKASTEAPAEVTPDVPSGLHL